MPAEQGPSCRHRAPTRTGIRGAARCRPHGWASEVRVAGWVHRRRDHGGLVFVDLRDRTGLLQVVFNPETAPEAHARSHELRSEWVISVRGEVVRRSEETINRDMATGEVEVRAADYEVLGERRDAALPDRRGDAGGRGAAPALPLPRPAPRADAALARAAPRRHAGDPRLPRRPPASSTSRRRS